MSYDDSYRICAACDEPVEEREAFVENHQYFHASCAGVKRCEWCGEFGSPKDGMMVIGPEGSVYHAQCWELEVKPAYLKGRTKK